MSRLLVPWLGLGLSAGFLIWIILIGPGELQQVPAAIRRYLYSLPAGLAVAGVVCALLWFSRVWNVAANLSYVSCVFYLSFLKMLGWDFIPWVLVVIPVMVFIRSREFSIEARWSLLLLHLMGSMTGLYMTFNLGRFLQPWKSFREIVQSLWLLAFY